MYPTLLTPGLLEAVSVFVAGSSIYLVAVHTTFFTLAARKSGISPRAQALAPLLVAGGLAAWSGWAIISVSERVVAPEPWVVGAFTVQAPSLLLAMSVMTILGIVVLFASKTIGAINAAMPPSWLIAVQTYRVEGVMFLWPFLAAHALPKGFALPAGIGDVLTGIFAPFVARAVAQNRPGAYRSAIIWNWFGILDLVVAVTTAVVTQSTNIARFPIVIVPLFLGPPLGILTHLYSLRNLRVTRKAQPVVNVADESLCALTS
jgi:hypothetical protein